MRTARGRAVAAAEVPWMRVREVWVHAADLAAGTTFAEVPQTSRALVVDALTGRLGRDDGAALRVRATDADLDIADADADAGTAATVSAPLVELLPWALGRPPGHDHDWPALPPWL